MVKICYFAVSCECFNFAFNFAMLHHLATAYLFVPRMVTLAGYAVFSGHQVIVVFIMLDCLKFVLLLVNFFKETFSSSTHELLPTYFKTPILLEIKMSCYFLSGPVDEYQLPFEDEVGQHPSLQDMQEEVVQKKLRPLIKETWHKHQVNKHLLGIKCDCHWI